MSVGGLGGEQVGRGRWGHSASPQGSWSGEAPVSWRRGLRHAKVPHRSVKAPGRSVTVSRVTLLTETSPNTPT